jgi:hypothetical protein
LRWRAGKASPDRRLKNCLNENLRACGGIRSFAAPHCVGVMGLLAPAANTLKRPVLCSFFVS